VGDTSVERGYGIRPPGFRLPDDTRPGAIRLQVSDLSRSLAYYRDFLGFIVVERDRSTARLHAHGERDHLIELNERPGTRPTPRSGIFGLYHFAILLPSRETLGRFIAHVGETGVQFGAADHLVSEAVYLWDPDGLGIEVYVDRPRDSWRTRASHASLGEVDPANGRELMMTTDRLDLEALVDSGRGERWQGMPQGTTLGLMHLSVPDLDAARGFYHDALGFDLIVWSYPGALFMSAGGYHHHLGVNVWARGARLPTDNDARLTEWALRVPNAAAASAAFDSLRGAGYRVANGLATDPWGVDLRLSVPTDHDAAIA
jgi:catechol 2,3-dioxygenase